ncbi:homeodomain-interacting protein kinase 2-like [Melanotaenia boesemani]|uniref:homeodomain-interacting protein kinase 2-like n=1 Tax=Melanotaenia boesemani TaxID=1250792 RepID=UPI001C04BB5F|nr:homeodomain-interacting protein kinase 2-like [Melanotaenia boesemani]
MSLRLSSDAVVASVTPAAPEIQAGGTLLSGSSSYSVLEFIGEGCFGKVAKCQKLETNETVAVKILKKDTSVKLIEKELSILKDISVLDPDIYNVVKFLEQFEHMGQTCLAFEMLEKNLDELLREYDFDPLLVNVIRPIAAQLLVALDALKSLAILHTDIKPDNIMLVSPPDQSFRIKLVDFGLAIPASQVHPGLIIQPLGYRAPEVVLGLPFTEAVDVWGVGCLLAFLYLGGDLFPASCPYQMMRCIVKLLGQPEDHILRAGRYTLKYFKEEETADGARWSLMTPETDSSDATQKLHSLSELFSSLDDLVDLFPSEVPGEYEDRKVFVDLLKQLLHLEGDQRISPREALQHPFITMSHLTGLPDSRDYRIDSKILMSFCSAEKSADMVDTSAASEPHQESVPGFSVEDPHSGTRDDRPSSSSGDGATSTKCSDNKALSLSDEDPSASSSVSSSGSRKLLKRIWRLFSRIKTAFSCCWRPAVED